MTLMGIQFSSDRSVNGRRVVGGTAIAILQVCVVVLGLAQHQNDELFVKEKIPIYFVARLASEPLVEY